jgi:hypothetical protein
MAAHPFTDLSPADAAVALRSFGRRFRDAAAAASSGSLDEEPTEVEVDDYAARTGADGRSALDHLAAAADRLDAAREAVRAALVDAGRRVDDALLDLEPPEPGHHSGSLAHELGRIERFAVSLAEVVEGADAERWLDTHATSGGGSTTPLAVVQTTVAFALDRLKAVERVLREVRGRPT